MNELDKVDVETLLKMRADVDRELATRKSTLQKQLAALGGIRPARAPRSDKGTTRDKRVVSVVTKREPVDLEAISAANREAVSQTMFDKD